MRHRVLITRDPSRSVELIKALQAEEFNVIAEPVTFTLRLADVVSLPDLSRLDWIVFTSSTAVEVFADILHESGRTIPPDVRLAAVGSATAQIVRDRLHGTDIVTGSSGGARLAELLLEHNSDEPEFTVLWPCAKDAMPDFAEGMRRGSAKVIKWKIYSTVHTPPWILNARLERPTSFDVVLFAAPSAVISLKEAWPEPWTFTAVAIGETTARLVEEFTLTPCVTSHSPRTSDLVAAVKKALTADRFISITSVERN